MHAIAADVQRLGAQLRQLASNMAAAAATEPRSVLPRAAPRHVLLTGATGFVGSALLRSLLSASAPLRFRVTCIVRGASDADAAARVDEDLRAMGSVTVLAGDLLRERFGLPQARYNALVADIDVVVHAAAHVNLLLPYDALRDANVLGTYNACAAALQASALRNVRLIYVSSNAVKQPSERKTYAEIDRTPRALRKAVAKAAAAAGVKAAGAENGNDDAADADDDDTAADGKRDGDDATDGGRAADDEDDVDPLPLTGSGQSKVAAEALVRTAAAAVVNSSWLSACSVRLGNVGPPRDNPEAANKDDFMRAIFAAAHRSGVLPSPFFIELTPIDLVCDTLVRLCQFEQPGGVVHVANAARFDARMLCRDVQHVDKSTFIAKCKSDELGVLLSSPVADELLCPPRLLCARAKLVMPDLPFDYLLAALGLGAPSEPGAYTFSATSRPLVDKLIIVLGASSGIGCAIAEQLVRRGARVVACARRECNIDGAISMRCDVSKRG